MSALTWDNTGERLYETGVSNGVLYVWDDSLTTPAYGAGVAWNGLVSVTESPSGAEPTSIYADNIKYLTLMSVEEMGATVEAYTYPDEFAECDGSAALATGLLVGQQPRKKFCLVYKTKIGNDTNGDAYGYKIHILYNCLASPSEKAYQTVNDSPEAITFSWELNTTPEAVLSTTDNTVLAKPTASIVIDSTKADATKLAALEDQLFGSAGANASILMPGAVVAALS